jgi:hypothetical protein
MVSCAGLSVPTVWEYKQTNTLPIFVFRPHLEKAREAGLSKSIGKRSNPQWRSFDNTTAKERPLQSLNFGNDPTVGSSPHPTRTSGNWIDDRTRAAKALTQPVSPQIGSRLRISKLAFVDWAANTHATVVAGKSLKQPCYTILAKWAEQPWALATEVAARPRDADLLRGDLIAQHDVDQIAIQSDPFDSGPLELRPARSAITVQQSSTVELAHIETIDCQFLHG